MTICPVALQKTKNRDRLEGEKRERSWTEKATDRRGTARAAQMAQQGQLKSRWHSFGGQQWWVLRGEGNSDSAGGQGTPLSAFRAEGALWISVTAKTTGVWCWKRKGILVAQSCLTLCDPMDSSQPGPLCYAQCPNLWAGREKASKTVQLAKQEGSLLLTQVRAPAARPTQWYGVRERWAQAVTQFIRCA